MAVDRWQAQYNFWSSFDVPAYEANSVPDYDLKENPAEYKAQFPYITYSAAASGFDEDTVRTASVWTRSSSWLQADTISDRIESALKNGGILVSYDNGTIWITPASPFSQNMGDPDDDYIKRKVLNVVLHFS